jgi:hypothetical protein
MSPPFRSSLTNGNLEAWPQGYFPTPDTNLQGLQAVAELPGFLRLLLTKGLCAGHNPERTFLISLKEKELWPSLRRI